MIALVMSPETEKRIKEVIDHAMRPENRRVGGTKIVGDDDAFTVYIPLGFKAVFSIDGNGEGDWLKHLSVSLTTSRGMASPNKQAMYMIAKSFGFTEKADYGTLPSDPVWVIHAIEEFNDDPDKKE